MINNSIRSMVSPHNILILILVFSASLISIQYSHAQVTDNNVTTKEQVTLSDDLANNPLAQDILRKIEQT